MAGGGQARMLAPAPQLVDAPPSLQSFADVVALIDAKRDIVLKLDVERFVRPVSFRLGAIEFEPAPGAPANLAQRLVGRLKEWTGQPWLITVKGGGGAESQWELQRREEQQTRAEIGEDPFVRAVMTAFPGAEIVSIRNTPLPEATGVVDTVDDDED